MDSLAEPLPTSRRLPKTAVGLGRGLEWEVDVARAGSGVGAGAERGVGALLICCGMHLRCAVVACRYQHWSVRLRLGGCD